MCLASSAARNFGEIVEGSFEFVAHGAAFFAWPAVNVLACQYAHSPMAYRFVVR